MIIKVSAVIGGTATLLALIMFCAGGAWVVKHEGLAALGRVRDTVNEGRVPTMEVIDGFLVLAAGIMLLLPGFITSIAGLILIIAPVRAVARRSVAGTLDRRVSRRFPAGGTSTGTGSAAGGTAGPRFYRRPDEADEATARAESTTWGARVRAEGAGAADVIDVDGEEIIFPYGAGGEIGPSE